MTARNSKNIVLPRATLKRKEGVVILDLSQYEKIRKKMEKLEEERRRQREEEKILEIINKGEKEYKKGKIRPIKSLKELR